MLQESEADSIPACRGLGKTSFAANNNFHRLEITGLNFSDPSLSIFNASLDSTIGNMPVTSEDILFGSDFVFVEIGGWWDDLSQVVIKLESGVASVSEPSVPAMMISGLLGMRLARMVALR